MTKKRKKAKAFLKKLGSGWRCTWGLVRVNGRHYPPKEGWKRIKESFCTFVLFLALLLLSSIFFDGLSYLIEH